jgi:hypothetical protein
MKPVHDDLGADVRVLLDRAARGIEPPKDARGRVSRRLAHAIAGLPMTSSGVSDQTLGPSFDVGRSQRTAGPAPWSLGPVASAFVAGIVVGATGYATLRARSPDASVHVDRSHEGRSSGVMSSVPSAPAPGAASAPSVDLAETSAREGSRSESPVIAHDIAPGSSGATVRSTRTSDLDAERALLDVGRRALAAGRAEEVLKAAREHARRYPEGVLVEEREALVINALAASSRYTEARDRADRFLRRFPESLLRPAVEAAIGTIPK